MKNLLITLVMLTVIVCAHAQDSTTTTKHKFFQKVSIGLIPGIVATTDFTSLEKPFSTGFGLLGDISISTPKSYHSLMYGFGDNSVKTINGYFLPKEWDTYAIYSHALATNKQYLGLGIEKMVPVVDGFGSNLNLFMFCEAGTDFEKTNSLTIGVLISVQAKVWKRGCLF